jgi:predicted nucleic acid-binding protein
LSRILLDTNMYAAFKRGDTEIVEMLRLADEIALSSTILGELLAGFAAGRREGSNREELAAFLDSPRVRVVDVDAGTADQYARVYTLLRRKGKPIPTNDLWTAASALQHGYLLASRDQHFAAIQGLATVSHPSDLAP